MEVYVVLGRGCFNIESVFALGHVYLYTQHCSRWHCQIVLGTSIGEWSVCFPKIIQLSNYCDLEKQARKCSYWESITTHRCNLC